MKQLRAIFLDRDGVLIRAFERDGVPRPPRSMHDLEILPGVVEACTDLRAAGWLLICVTNQPDIARGTVDPELVREINESLAATLELDDLLVCPHDDDDGCDCRKPQPGMLTRSAAKWGVHLERSIMVGDRWRDIAAGRSAGCKTVFIDHGYSEQRPDQPDIVVSSLRESASWILAARDWS